MVPKEDNASDHVLELLKPYTKENGGPLEVERVHFTPGRGNVIIKYPGTKCYRYLLFIFFLRFAAVLLLYCCLLLACFRLLYRPFPAVVVLRCISVYPHPRARLCKARSIYCVCTP